MYLKKVEIQGFKSFADKTEIEFKNEVTAIVGPNGSGKSNISDAIRWVLGEQSIKNLRGNKMEDVIFSGTDKRRPLGYAEVTITFDNKSGAIPVEYNEVAVTRRMFRSGESEYYLNKSACRLKDIRELFMDTGIGKDGYSIIGQGRIDEILSNRPEDRRSIFEEAAGIVKYRSKKEEAERKLERTETNLTRIKDLLLEITRQSETLEVESEKAILFTKIFNRLKELEVNLIIRDIKKLDGQIKDIEKEKLLISEDISLIEKEKTIIESKYNLLKVDLEKMDREIEETRNLRFETVKSLESYKNQISLLNEKEGFFKKDLERLEIELISLKENLLNLENSHKEFKENRDLIISKLNNVNEDFNLKNNELTHISKFLDEKEKTIELEKNKILNLYNKSADTRSELNSILSFNENITKRIDQLNKDIQNIHNEKNSKGEKLEELLKEQLDLKEVLEGKSKLLDSLKEDSSAFELDYRNILDSLKSNQIKLQGLTSSLNLYKNMEEGYEGYYKSVKNLILATKKSNDLSKGFLGVVADLLKVESKYERAIDISLGSSVQNLVVETDNDAKNMIEYLKTHKLGRVTFLPLNTIRGNTLNININDMKEFKVLGLAHELISYEDKYENIFEYLLGRTIIIEDLDNAIRFASKYNHSYKIVTLDGEVLNPGGSLTGGSYGNNSISIINRKNKIVSLENEVKTTQEVLSDFEIKKGTLLEKIEKNNAILVKEEKLIKDKELELINQSNEIGKITNDIDRLDNNSVKLNEEIISLRSETGNLSSRKEILVNSLKNLEEETNDLKISVKKLSDEMVNEKLLKDELTNKVTSIKIEINTLENSIKNIDEKINNFKIESDKIKDLITDKEKNINLNNDEITNVNVSKSDILVSIETIEEEEVNISSSLEKLMETKENFMKNFYEEQERLKEINKKLGIMEKQKNNQEVKLTRLELYLENNYTRLSNDYEMEYEQALKFESPIGNVQNAIEEAKTLKSKIKDLGHVNLGSIDEYKNVKERLDFNTTQYNDLLESKEKLKDVIVDMEKTMRIQFVEALEEINENFVQIFSILFNGGKAALELEENEDILKAGIEIKAQPPGKKLQSLSLLSGGEKSLTAVALLFAILQSKPSPFCILDEIDAALDEANISRYTNYLRSFNDGTQFVLITHRKTTMEIADVLYGVTMEEEGVSKLISVKLKDNLDEIAS